LWLRNDSPVVRMRVVGSARRRRTVTCSFSTAIRAAQLTMDVPGGIVERPVSKLYQPTFWPARSFVHLRTVPDGVGIAAFLGGPAAVTSDGLGTVEWVALRYAPRERAFGLLPIPAHPASGTDPHEGQLDYAVWLTPHGDAYRNGLPHHVRRALRAAMFAPGDPDLDDLANSVVVVDHSDVMVTALKPAYDGNGVVVRLASFARAAVTVALSCPARPICWAALCSARERDLGPLEVRDGVALVPVSRALASVRVGF
jgi:hypothetical protein